MATTLPSRAELEKLKLPDLKKLCKEHNITAYSKLNKKDLIDKVASALSLITPPTSSVSSTANAQAAINSAATSFNASIVRGTSTQPPRADDNRTSVAKDMVPPSKSPHAAPAHTPARTEDTSSGARQITPLITSVHHDQTPQSSKSRTTASTASGLPRNPSSHDLQSRLARSASRITTIASLVNDTSTAHLVPLQSQPPSNNASIPVAQFNQNNSMSTPTPKPPVKGRPKRQLIEMTEENYAELERLKRQKISATVRVRANNSQTSAQSSQAVQRNLSTLSINSIVPATDDRRDALPSPVRAPSTPSQQRSRDNSRLGLPPSHLEQPSRINGASQIQSSSYTKQPSQVRQPSQVGSSSSHTGQPSQIREPPHSTFVPSPSAQSIRTESARRAIKAPAPLRNRARSSKTPMRNQESTETFSKTGPAVQPIRTAPDGPAASAPNASSVPALAQPEKSAPVKPQQIEVNIPVTPSAARGGPKVASKTKPKATASQKERLRAVIQSVSAKPTSKFRPLQIVRPPVEKAKQPDPPILVTVALAEKPLEIPAGATKSEIEKIIKASFLERLYRANKAAAGRPVLADDMAFDGLAANMLDGSQPAENLNVAIRFVVARLHTRFQLGEWQDPVGFAPVQRVQKLCDGIWVVETDELMVNQLKAELGKSTSTTKTKAKGRGKAKVSVVPEVMTPDVPSIARYLIVGETGDVISRFEQPLDLFTPSDVALSNFGLRPDWQAYLESKTDISRCPSTSAVLLDRVRTKHEEDFSQGIARIWLKRMEANLDADVVRVAKRYVLSNVVLNSISGELLSTMQMDAIWAGKAGAEVKPKVWNTVSLFLPESHQVESVSFNIATNGKRYELHPSIAVVARKTSEDLVLRMTGQVIGNIDQGVSELYKHVLGCDDRGVAVSYSEAEKLAENFWRGFNEAPRH